MTLNRGQARFLTMTKKKTFTWKDNFTVEEETPSEPQKRVGTCSNCDYGSFTLGLGKGRLKGVLLRQCKSCLQVENPDTGEVIRKGEVIHETK